MLYISSTKTILLKPGKKRNNLQKFNIKTFNLVGGCIEIKSKY